MTLAAVAVRADTSTITTWFPKFKIRARKVLQNFNIWGKPGLQIMPFNQKINICVAQRQDGISGEEPGLGHGTGY